MNLTQLESVLALDNGTLNVTGAALSSSSITAVLGMYFGGTLNIAGATLSVNEQAQSVSVSGAFTLLQIPGTAVATFTLVNGIPQLSMPFEALDQSSWTFADSFTGINDPLLSQLVFESTEWLLLSQANDTQPAGLWFQGTWTPPAPLEAIDWLLGGNLGAMTVAGPLNLVNGLPQVAFTFGTPYQNTFGSLVLTVRFSIQSAVYTSISPAQPSTCVGTYVLSSSLSNTGATITVPAVIVLTSNFDLFTLSVDTSQLLTVTVADLVSWIGGSELAGNGIPAGLSTDGLSLRGLEIVFSSAAHSILSISLQVGVTGVWTIVPNVLSIENLALNVFVTDPFGDSRTFLNTVSGELSIEIAGGNPVIIDIAATFPNFTVRGSLPDGNEEGASLAGMMAGGHGVGASAGFSDGLTISSLLFFADPSLSLYSFAVSVADDWQITTSLSLIDLQVSVHYSEGELSAVLEVGLVLCGININLAADYDSSTGGWQLSGSTGPGQQIAIADLIADVLTIFDVTTTLPSSLAGLTIDNVAIQMNTQSLSFSLSLDVQFPIDGTPLDATISIQYTRTQTGGYTIAFSGVVVIDQQQFALIFDEVSS